MSTSPLIDLIARVDELYESGAMSAQCAWALRMTLLDEGISQLERELEAPGSPEMAPEPSG